MGSCEGLGGRCKVRKEDGLTRKFILISILFILLCAYLVPAGAHPSAQAHYDELELVLFGGKYTGVNREALTLIEYASTLAIDQFNGFHSDILTYLSQHRISGLPPDVKTSRDQDRLGINYTASPHTHREATHRGWDWNYAVDKGNWPVRKNILLSTVTHVFGFKGSRGDYDKQCNSFCALVYYVHLIGDHQEDSKYKEDGPIVSLAEKNFSTSNIDIFYELDHHLSILFSNQKDTHLYRLMMDKLRKLGKETRALTGSTGGINTPEKLESYHAAANELIQILRRSVPELLRREDFFNRVF